MKLRSADYQHLSINTLGVLAYVQYDPMSVKTITTYAEVAPQINFQLCCSHFRQFLLCL